MAIGNCSTLVFFLVLGIHFLLCCYPSNGLVIQSNPDEKAVIESDVQSSSLPTRQYVMPAIDPYAAGLLMNFQQQKTPSNTLSQKFYGKPNITIANPDTSQLNFDDGTLKSSRQQQQQYPCGRGPAPIRQWHRQSESEVALRFNGLVGCSGSLISPNNVLTAAHCVEKLTSGEISTLTVSLGMHIVGNSTLKTTNDAQMTRRVSRIIIHNGYHAQNQSLLNTVIPLSCYAARVIWRNGIRFDEDRLPFHLQEFVQRHSAEEISD